MKERRYMVAYLPSDLLVAVLQGRARFVGFPDGAVLVRVGYSLRLDGLELLLTHPSFAVVDEGVEAPVLCLGVDYAIAGT